MTDPFQYFPTPSDLVRRAWKKFKDRDFVRVLEPSAGDGHLADGNPRSQCGNYGRIISIDCCEIDLSHHATLRAKGYQVIGLDFLKMTSAAQYSHILLNPPFAEGARHVLHAWDVLFDGEIVAILNADTLRNPYSQERRRLAALVESRGEVEYLSGAFAVMDAERKTDVDVALIWLKKTADAQAIYGELLSDLRRDNESGAGLAADYDQIQSVALPASEIENRVLAFDAAVKSMRDAVIAEARANHYSALLGETMAVRCAGTSSTRRDTSVDFVRKELGERYITLKDRAWAGILRSTDVTSRLSSKAQKRLESEFEDIKKLDFTVSNVYGFLCGLIDKQGEIQVDMVNDIFDAITRYHTDNTVFYKGWKSNDKHLTAARRIKHTRFILPGHGDCYRDSLNWDSERLLADFDKVFAMMDGKHAPSFGLVDLFRTRFRDLVNGERLGCDYFAVRFYPGVGTIHFFTTRLDLIDRLNRTVGRQRQWIPPETANVSENFWTQYQKAEKFDRELRAEIRKLKRSHWDDPLHRFDSTDPDERTAAARAINAALATVLERHGIPAEFQIAHQQTMQVPLLMAA